MKRIIFFLVLTVLVGGGIYFLFFRSSTGGEKNLTPSYEFGEIQRRDILNMVSATGTLAARDVVEVGTQVSGTLSEIRVDFNDQVEEGQLIALIDPSVLDLQVMSAEADVLRAEAQLNLAKNKLERFSSVHDQGFLSDSEFEVYEIEVQMAEAALLNARAGLERAKRNRSYAEITAPISGVVIDRAVEPGQTVAATLSAPRLFTIANDLSKMEILAEVDESDIGQIKVGQDVRFTVAAYPEATFNGAVEEIRLMPKIIQNVVNYTVVVTAENRRGQLLPGMTATLDFVIEEVADVLSVPASALNLRLDGSMEAIMRERREQRMAQRGGDGLQSAGDGPRRFPRAEGGGTREPGAFGGPGGNGDRGGARRPDIGMLWFQEDGKLAFIPVRQGVSDGAYAEVIPLREEITLEEGMAIITKVNSPSTASTQNNSGDGPPRGLRRLGF